VTHRWHFFRAGGVDQVSLRNAEDIRALAELDRKLWVALAMPTKGVDLDPETLALIDLGKDGSIRVVDVLDTIKWLDTTFVRLDDVLESASEIKLAAIKDATVLAAAKRMLADLGKPDATSITVEDASAITKAFAETKLNGDGVVIAASTDDADLQRAIEDAIACAGSVPDLSGKPGIDQAKADAFFAAVDERVGWLQRDVEAPLGEATAAASDALHAVREKLEDYFTRCRVAAFDPRGAAALGGQDAELVALAAHSLSPSDEDLAKFPLAQIDPRGKLTLGSGLNPAWAARIHAFVAAMQPILGAREDLLADDLAKVTERLAAHEAWRASEPKTIVDALDITWLERLALLELRDKLKVVIAADAALSGEYAQITSVAKAVRLQRDFGRLLRNFVNFSDFYSRQDGVFQCGELYLDARALHLCVAVNDQAKHAALATSSDAYLLYCDIVREGVTKQVAVAVTNGDADNIFIGRNGVFYDREGNDWFATIVKVIANPISIREAFWSPYKKLVKVIEDNVTRRAAAADAEAAAKLEATGKAVATTDKQATPEPPHPPAKKIDLGTVAAIGVAIGGIGTLVGAVMASMFGLGAWLPIGLLALMLLISGPSMILAWLKLRRRNLGPILDANGWAINGRAKINVAFGAAMTELAKLPKGSQRTLDDPFADKRTPWRRWVVLAVIVVLAGTWYVGKLDDYLPDRIMSTTVLGDHAPAAKKAAKEAAKDAPAPAKP
jgi:hypothetical protein